MARVIGATSYGNHHLLVSTFPNISLLVKHLVKDAVFEQQLGRGMGKETQLCDIFSEETINISSKVVLENYVNCARRNWQNTTTQNTTVQATVEDNSNEDINNTIEGGGRNNKFNGK